MIISSNEDRVYAELVTHAGLLPGAARTLAQRWRDIGNGSPAYVAQEVFNRLYVSGLGVSFLNPEHREPLLENGAEPSQLRQIISRRPGLREGAVEALVAELGPTLNGMNPARVAGAVVSKLEEFGSRKYLLEPPPLPAGETRLLNLISENFAGNVPHNRALDLAHDLYARGRHIEKDDGRLVVEIATILRIPQVAAKFDATAVEPNDERLTYVYSPPAPQSAREVAPNSF